MSFFGTIFGTNPTKPVQFIEIGEVDPLEESRQQWREILGTFKECNANVERCINTIQNSREEMRAIGFETSRGDRLTVTKLLERWEADNKELHSRIDALTTENEMLKARSIYLVDSIVAMQSEADELRKDSASGLNAANRELAEIAESADSEPFLVCGPLG